MGGYDVSRTVTISADAARVHALVDDFHEWPAWSPWEGLDPDLERTYSGPAKGVGSRYAWKGNRKAGAGDMTIVTSDAGAVVIDLHFLKPFRSESRIEFDIAPAGQATGVTWRMTGEQKGLQALFGRIVPMDRLVGKDFERGLLQLKGVAEAQ